MCRKNLTNKKNKNVEKIFHLKLKNIKNKQNSNSSNKFREAVAGNRIDTGEFIKAEQSS